MTNRFIRSDVFRLVERQYHKVVSGRDETLPFLSLIEKRASAARNERVLLPEAPRGGAVSANSSASGVVSRVRATAYE